MSRALCVLAAVCIALAGCEDGSGTGSPPAVDARAILPPDAFVENHLILSWDVAGTTEDTAAGSAPIDPAQPAEAEEEDRGKFAPGWEVRHVSAGLLLQLFLSDDAAYSPDDTSFYEHYCMSGEGCGMGSPHRLQCAFNSANEILCAGETVGQDITAFLGTLPREAFIVARTCDMRYLNCDVRAHPVRFQ